VPDALLRAEGIDCERLDPGAWPRNPLGHLHPFYRAFDPARLARAWWSRRRYDLIVSGNDAAAFALVSLRRVLGGRTPIAIWDFSPDTAWRPRVFTQDRTLPHIDGLLALNLVQVSYVAERWGAHVPVIVVGHMVDTTFFQPTAGNADYVLAVGDDAGRDYPTLLAAIHGMREPIRIRTSHSLGDVAPPAVWLRERVSAIGLRDLYTGARFVVVPLRPDTRNASGISTILEAGAMGRAVVVSDSDGVREFVRDGETALVVPARDPAALRAAIDRLLADPALAHRLGMGGRAWVERIAAPGVFAPRLAGGYRALVERARAG
jgi:glycosyltransferase involved in cell wall biosynthesis